MFTKWWNFYPHFSTEMFILNRVSSSVKWYCTSWQSIDKGHYLKIGLEDALEVSLLLSANQSEWSFQSEFSGYTIFTFHFNEENVLFTQWEIICDWFHMMTVEQIKWTPNFNLWLLSWDNIEVYDISLYLDMWNCWMHGIKWYMYH